MQDKDYQALTGFKPTTWQSPSTPAWAPDGLDAACQAGLGVPTAECMHQRAMLLFPGDAFPAGFPAGLSFGRALLEARTEFLELGAFPPFGDQSPFRVNGELAVETALTSLGLPCPPPPQEDFFWLLGHLELLADVEPRVIEEGQGKQGLGGTLIRTYHGRANPDHAEAARLLRLFTPDTASTSPQAPMSAGAWYHGLKVVNSRTHGLGLLHPGEPAWDYLARPDLDQHPILDPERLGVPDAPVLVQQTEQGSPCFWLPLTEIVPRFRIRLEVVLQGHLRHRASVMRGMDQRRREHLPDPVVVCSVDYLPPLEQRAEGLDGPMLGGLSAFAGYSPGVRREIASLTEKYPHRTLSDITKACLAKVHTLGVW